MKKFVLPIWKWNYNVDSALVNTTLIIRTKCQKFYRPKNQSKISKSISFLIRTENCATLWKKIHRFFLVNCKPMMDFVQSSVKCLFFQLHIILYYDNNVDDDETIRTPILIKINLKKIFSFSFLFGLSDFTYLIKIV